MSSKLYDKAVGICLGASTFSLVEIEKENNEIKIINKIIKPHEGDPKGVFSKILGEYDLKDKYLAVTGRKFREILNIPSITEPEATEIAFKYVNKENKIYDAIVSAGGETFMAYQIDKMGRISRVISGNKCASGTGEFFLQQIRRMNVTLDEAIRLSKTSKNPHQLSGRCSVFCKSDCTHALNKGESVADVTAGLSKMIAKKIEELLVKINAKKVMIVGGTAQNSVVIDFVRENMDVVDVPEEAPYFEALGAAIWAMEHKQDKVPSKENYFKHKKPSFETLKPLMNFIDRVEFKELPLEKANEGDECILGLDVGSTTTKAVLMRVIDDKILASVYLRTNGRPIEASRECYKSIYEQLNGVNVKIIGLGVTGSGRYIAGLHAQTDGIINEIIAHARAATYFDPDVDTIFEIGGQDAKYTYLINSVASDYAMNEACSAGTGSFLEESAYESLGVKMTEIADIAFKAKNPPNFSDQCSAFISSDIKTALQEGISKDDIIAGLVYSICINYINRVKGARQVGNKIFMQGGVCYNMAVPVAMAALTGKKIIVPPHPGLMGAYGVALEVKNMLLVDLLERKEFDLKKLAERTVEYGRSFICQGKPENCDRKCEINMIHIEDKKFPFGGACNKYYNQLHHIQYNVSEFNHVVKRTELLFKKTINNKVNLKENAPVVGLNKSFEVHTLFPMFYTFFTELGCKVILPDNVNQKGIDKGMTSYCLSGQISLGLFDNLLEKNPDYIFLPQITEMHVTKQEQYRKQYQSTCMFVEGEPFYLKATFLRELKDKPKLITPFFNFMAGFDSEEAKFVSIAQELGFSREEGIRAHRLAYEKQMEFFRAMKEEGKRILENLEKNPDKVAIVLFGRPYNAFADETNKGVPFKFASRGVEIIPYDFLLYEQEENFRGIFWEMGQRIIRAARIVKRHPQLFACYLTNFLCALDSIVITHFRDLMGSKPSLTLEVDSHTADAGINTRIEAFMDVIKNYLKVKNIIKDPVFDFQPAKTEIDKKGKAWFIDSEGKKIPFTDPTVKVLIPSMGDLFNNGMAAVLRRMGWNAEPLERCDREALDLGRSVTTGKECLPVINIIGEVLKYLKYKRKPGEKVVVFLVSAGGGCRVGQYQILLKTVLEKYKYRDVAVATLGNDDGYLGLGVKFRLNAVKILYLTDVLEDIRNVILAMAENKEEGMRIFNEEFNKIISSMDKTSKVPFFKQIKKSIKEFKKIKLKKPLSEAKYIGVVGEIFVRRDHFSLQFLPERLAEQGFVVLSAPVTEWIRYTDFLRKIKMFVPRSDLGAKLEDAISDFIQDYYERKIKKLMSKTGLYEYEIIDIHKYLSHATHLFPMTLIGEPGLSSGAALAHLAEKYCGVINVGPFGCMNLRLTESVATQEMTVEGKIKAAMQARRVVNVNHIKNNIDVLPFLNIEFDGNPFPQILEARLETFLLQANRLYETMKNAKN